MIRSQNLQQQQQKMNNTLPYTSQPPPQDPHRPLKRTSSLILAQPNNPNPFHPNQQHIEQSVKSVQSQSNPSKKLPMQLTRQLMANSKRVREERPIGVKDVLRSALRVFVCKMCYNNVQVKDTGTLGNCGHTFCLECLTQYAIYKVKVHEDVLCPEENCKVKLTPNQQFFHHLPEQVQQKFKQNELWKQTFDNPNLKLCQKQQCKGGLVDMTKIPPECQKCHAQYCKECMMAFHQGPCDENFQYQFKEWKRCANCKIFIQKTQGCNHMTCRCGHQFCFVCMANWEPSHYQCVEGLENRLFFAETETMPKTIAVLALIGLCLLVPLMIVGLVVMLALGVAFTSAIGIIVAPCALAKQISSCCCCCIFWIILTPFAMVIGAIASPIFFVISVFKPFAHRVMRQHCNSIQFLIEQIKGRDIRRARRASPAPVPAQIEVQDPIIA